MWSNGRNAEFNDAMGQGSIIKSTTIFEIKACEIAEGSPLFHTINKLMSKFDELEGRMSFVAPIFLLYLMM
jgi:hypothetical protein